MLCVVKYGYGRMIDTSGRGSILGIVCISIGRKERSYDHSHRNKEVCEHF